MCVCVFFVLISTVNLVVGIWLFELHGETKVRLTSGVLALLVSILRWYFVFLGLFVFGICLNSENTILASVPLSSQNYSNWLADCCWGGLHSNTLSYYYRNYLWNFFENPFLVAACIPVLFSQELGVKTIPTDWPMVGEETCIILYFSCSWCKCLNAENTAKTISTAWPTVSSHIVL